MNILNKLERKFGRYAITNLMFYITVLYGLGALLGIITPYFYKTYLILDMSKVLQGQVWRLFTFIIQPSGSSNPIFLFFELYIYYMIGNSLENAWGAFRFNLFFLTGLVFNILAAILLFLIIGGQYPFGLTYINRSMFLAYAVLFPNVQFLLFFIIPVKVKYLGYLYGAYVIIEIMQYIAIGGIYGITASAAIVVSLANFLFYFFTTRNYRKISPKEYNRKARYKREIKNTVTDTRHKCSVCGKTEEDDDSLEFRFCSKCDGNHEYCMHHLFTHEHIHLK